MSDGIHVWRKGELWLVTRGNYTLDEFANQQQAVQLGKQRARTSRAKVIIHADDGSVNVIDNFMEAGSRRRKQKRPA